MPRRKSRATSVKRMARTRIDRLWEMACESGGSALARRYVEILRRVAQKARIKVPRHIKRRICKKCNTVLVPGENCRVRMRTNRSSHITVTCFTCGAIRRYYVRR